MIYLKIEDNAGNISELNKVLQRNQMIKYCLTLIYFYYQPQFIVKNLLLQG